jgi:hypothetical protein
VRADRFGQRAFQTGQCGALEQNLAHPVRTQPGVFDRAAAVELAKQRPGCNFGQCQIEPVLRGGNRAGFPSLSVRDSDFGAFTPFVRQPDFAGAAGLTEII